MEIFHLILYGFSVVLQPANLLCAFLGAVAGTLVGVLPGLGPVGAMSMLLPVTYGMSPTGAMIMLAGIYYGAQYGGSTTSILVNIPGESASVVTCLDGYQMARQGRAGPALGIAAFSSFFAGTIGVLGLSFLAPPLVDAALTFGAPEYFALMCLGLTVLTFLAQRSMLKALIMAVLGLFVGTIGFDITTGIQRFTLGSQDLMEGVGLVQIAMGMFGICEILLNIEKAVKISIFETKLKGLFPNLQDWRRSIGAILRGTGIGFFLGILPGGGGSRGFSSLAAAKPDGYTIGLVSTSGILQPYLMKGVTFHYKKSFRIISEIAYTAEGIYVKKGGPFDMPFPEIIKRAKEKPNTIKAGVGGTWTGSDVVRFILEDATGAKFIRIPHPAGGQDLVPGVLGGHLDLAMGEGAQWAPLYKAGKFNVLAVSTERRDPRFPDIPTLKEMGYDVVLVVTFWVGAPAGTPDSVITFLAEVFRKAVAEEGYKEASDIAFNTASYKDPADALKAVEQLDGTFQRLIKKYDLKPE